MKTEIEAKFYPVDKEQIRSKLKKIGAKLVSPERMMRRTIFDKHANPAIMADYIRIRDEGGQIRLSAKIHARKGGQVTDQKELDILVSNYEETVELLKLSGLIMSAYQETLRETWTFRSTEIVIDTWPGLEPYIEIEAESEEELKKVAELLGQPWEKRRITSIIEVFSEVYSLTNKEVLNKLAFITFNNIPFEKPGP